MSLPSQANAFFLRSPDPGRRGRVLRAMRASGRFAETGEPGPDWLAGVDPLPGGTALSPAIPPGGPVFVEGAERFDAGDRSARHRTLAAQALSRPDRLARWPGDFGFAVFGDGGDAAFVRACGGLAPIYWWHDRHCLAVATRLEDLVRFAGTPAQIDPLTCAVWARGWGLFPDDRAPVAGVRVLPRGCVLRIPAAAGPPQVVRYWNPVPDALEPPGHDRFEAHAHELRELLCAYLDRHLDPEGGNLLTLSGGVDSTSLAALAVRRLARPVWTWSLLPPPGENLEREMDYIRPLQEELGIRRSWRFHHRPRARLALLESGPEVAFPIAHPALCDLPRVRSEAPVRVLFGGEFADEICGSGFTFHDWVAHTSPVSLLRSIGCWPRGRRDALRWLKIRYQHLRGQPPLPVPPALPAFAPAELQEEYEEWFARRLRSAAGDRRPLRHLRLNMRLDAFVAMNWEAAGALGIRRAFPFFHREVLELALRCHPRELVGPGYKRLLRRALRGIALERNLMRPDKGHWRADFGGRADLEGRTLPAALAPMVDGQWLRRHDGDLSYEQVHGLVLIARFARNLERAAIAYRRPLGGGG